MDHLDSEKIIYDIDGRQYSFFVTYSHHCFCKTVVDVNDNDEYLYPKDLRHFYMERYELTKALPELISSIHEKYIVHGDYSRYCVFELNTQTAE